MKKLSVRKIVQLGMAVLSLMIAGCGSSFSGPELSATEAFTKAQQGELTIVDVRTPAEWRRTGVPVGALEINMIQPGGLGQFVERVLAEVGGDKSAPVALICRTGNRSGQMQQALLDAGFTDVYNIREGMIGSSAGPGWAKRDLPIRQCTEC